MELTRRDVVKMSVLAGAAVALPIERSVSGLSLLSSRISQSALPAPFSTPFARPPVIEPLLARGSTDFFRVVMRPGTAQIIPGLRTTVWGYNGIFPGPTFKMTQGRPAVVRQVNKLPKVHPVLKYTPWTSVHLHGSASLPQYDGYASDITNPGQYKDYHYPNSQEARTLWYHDHGVHHTAQNVFMGLAGMYQLSDPLERSLPIPHGEFDVPLIVSDAMFNSDGSLLFADNSVSGFFGDVNLVNGRAWPAMPVKRRKYRFRILNGSVSRSYKWSLSTGDPMTVIATDAGLVPAPMPVRSFRHGVAERYEVVIDFAKYQPGQRVVLRNSPPPNTIEFPNIDKVMAFDVVSDAFPTADNSVPAVLNPDEPTMLLRPSQATVTRHFEFVRKNGLWTINGHTWDDVIRSQFTFLLANPRADAVEIWEVKNTSGGWHHPVHIHFIDFQILSRNGAPPMPHERGPKDVVYLGEGETVRLLMRFSNGHGKYMMHCHNTVHEDHDMMSQYEISDGVTPNPSPFSAPARDLPELPL
jgi:spore coat protein A, manganese oxidase